MFLFTGHFLLRAQNSLIGHEQFLADSLCNGKSEIYLFSDDYRIESSVELKFQLITTLNQKCGVRNIIIGAGSSEAWLYNRFFSTGDSTLLENTAGNNFSMVRDFWTRLYHFNKNLPDIRKLKFIGIDSEKPGPLKTVVSRLLAEEIKEPEISMTLFEIQHYPTGGYAMKNRKSFYKLLSQFNSSLLKNKSGYLKYMSDEDYVSLVIMTGNPVNNPALHKQRYRMMYDNLTSNEDLVPGKILTLVEPGAARNTMGTLGYFLDAEETSPYYGKVFIVDQYYYKCTYHGEPLKYHFPPEYEKLLETVDLESVPGNYIWLRSEALTKCDCLLIVKNKREVR